MKNSIKKYVNNKRNKERKKRNIAKKEAETQW